MESGFTSDRESLTPYWAGSHRRRFIQPTLDQRIKQETGPIKTYQLTPEQVAEQYPDPPQAARSKIDRLRREK